MVKYKRYAQNIYILAGPNCAGKTTFAKVLLPQILQIKDFVNADLIAPHCRRLVAICARKGSCTSGQAHA